MVNITRDEINDLILEKVSKADAKQEVKNLLKDLLNLERTQYTGRGKGGGYVKRYRKLGRKYLKRGEDET